MIFGNAHSVVALTHDFRKYANISAYCRLICYNHVTNGGQTNGF